MLNNLPLTLTFTRSNSSTLSCFHLYSYLMACDIIGPVSMTSYIGMFANHKSEQPLVSGGLDL